MIDSSVHVGPPSAHPLAQLHDPRTVRLRCASILRSVEAGLSPYFSIDREQLPALAERVAALTLKRYPDLRVPPHSRWRHFEAGGVDRKGELDALLAGRSTLDQARARFDLTVVSVLLGAGAGASWSFAEGRSLQAAALPQAPADELLAMLDRSARNAPAQAGESPPVVAAAAAGTERFYTRSEGLGVASFRAFLAGAFSGHPGDPLRADASVLRHVDVAALRALLQSSPANPVVGLEGRAALLSRLGTALHEEGKRSGHDARPGLIFERLSDGGKRSGVSATELLGEVLRCLSPIWPSGSKVQSLPGGDVWQHRWAGSDVASLDAADAAASDRTTAGWVPLHKLSQWMSYSLVEPLQWAGVQVTGLDALTGLAEYRNGGLLIDAGVIALRNPRLLQRMWKPQDELIIEWRALTIVLLDALAPLVRQRLGRSAEELPLSSVMEGGTWAAGREIALELRKDGAPPLQIDSDGTLI